MNYLFIIDPTNSLVLYKDTTVILMKECLRQNINIFYSTIDAISIDSKMNIEVEHHKIKSINESITSNNMTKSKLILE